LFVSIDCVDVVILILYGVWSGGVISSPQNCAHFFSLFMFSCSCIVVVVVMLLLCCCYVVVMLLLCCCYVVVVVFVIVDDLIDDIGLI